MHPVPEPGPVMTQDNPLRAAFAENLATPYGNGQLTEALVRTLPHLVEARQRKVPFRLLAQVLSDVAVASGGARVTEATLRGLFRRLRIRTGTIGTVAAAGTLPPVIRPAEATADRSLPPLEAASSFAPTAGAAVSSVASDAAAPALPASGLNESARRRVQATRKLRST